MGRNSNFERKPRDYYPTPLAAAQPLFKHLSPRTKFIEPCAGDGRLIRHFESVGHSCVYACDIEPLGDGIERRDCLMLDTVLPHCDAIITNPPWERAPMHQMIVKFRNHAPTWLLFDAGWMFTKQAVPYLPFCHSIVTIGRVIWEEGTKMGGKKDAVWYGFGKDATATVFYGK